MFTRFTKVSVLVPTRLRIQRLQKMLASYDATTQGVEAASELVFRVDDDDLQTQALLKQRGNCIVVVGPRLQGYDSMPAFFNELFHAATGDVMLCGNDDMVLRTDHWALKILQAANQFPDGLFDFGVSTHNETHFPFSIVSRRAAERLGFLWDPTIFWGDIFLRDTMAAFGRAVPLPEVQIDHEWAGFSPDQTFEEADKDIVKRIPNYWSSVHARAVHAAVSRLRELEVVNV